MSIADRLRGRRFGAKAQDDDEEPEDAKKAEGDEKEPEDAKKAQGDDEEDDKESSKSKKVKAQDDDEDDDDHMAEDDDDKEKAASPGRVAQMCADAGVPGLARQLIDTKLGAGAVRRRIEQAVEIKAVAARLRGRWPAISAAVAAELAAKGLSVQAAKATFLDLIEANQSGDVRNSHLPGGPAPAGQSDAARGWDAAIKKATGAGRF